MAFENLKKHMLFAILFIFKYIYFLGYIVSETLIN
jgi:hypothetical protein